MNLHVFVAMKNIRMERLSRIACASVTAIQAIFHFYPLYLFEYVCKSGQHDGIKSSTEKNRI